MRSLLYLVVLLELFDGAQVGARPPLRLLAAGCGKCHYTRVHGM